MTCDVCGRLITDDEACYPHDRGCDGQPHHEPWCHCDTIICPACCWECATGEAPT